MPYARLRPRARPHPASRVALAASMVCLGCLVGPAAAQSRTDTLVLSGQLAAGAGTGGVFSSFNAPRLNDAGQTIFLANMVGGTSTQGVYRTSPEGKPSAVAVRGQSATGAGAGTFSSFLGATLNDAGQTAFLADITGGTSTRGFYRGGSGGTPTAIALQGQSAAGAGTGTFSSINNFNLNNAGQGAFVASITGGSSTQGVYRSSSSGGPLTVIALQGENLGAGAGTFSSFVGPKLNDAGQVAFVANITGGSSTQGVYRSNSGGGSLTAIALQGQSATGAGAGTFSSFLGPVLNNAGQTAFVADITGGSSRGGIYRSSSGSTLTPLALLGQTAAGAGGGTFSSFQPVPIQMNEAGHVAFVASTTDSSYGIYRGNSDGTVTAIVRLGDPSGGTFANDTLALGEAGQIAFIVRNMGGTNTRDLAMGDGLETMAVQLQGATLAGKTVSSVSLSQGGLNRHGQVGYQATFTDGSSGNFLFTPALRWRSTTSGSWADAANWTLSLNPADVHDVTLDPTNSLTVTGPSNTVAMRSLRVGTGAGIATLAMAGGRIDAQSVLVGQQGVLSGTGSFGSLVTNQGTVQAERLKFLGGLDNAGTVRGAAGLGSRLEADLNNTSSGRVRVGSGETLQLTGKTHQNAGVVEVNGGRLDVVGNMTNAKSAIVDLKNATVVTDGAWRNDTDGRMLLNEARLTTSAGFDNAGQVQITSGSSEFFGAVRNEKGGQIILSGQGTTTFYDDVDAQSGSELRVSGGATAVFFGAVQQRSGAVFSGSGLKYYEGGFSVGNSPGAASDAGDVAFGLGNLYLAELGGTVPGTGHDFYDVAGTLTLGGTLQIVSWDGFTGQAGQSFDLFDWGQVQGAFGAIDSSGLLLAEGTRLDLSRLYLDGTVSVTAVPEPGTWALMLGGAGLLAWRRRVAR